MTSSDPVATGTLAQIIDLLTLNNEETDPEKKQQRQAKITDLFAQRDEERRIKMLEPFVFSTTCFFVEKESDTEDSFAWSSPQTLEVEADTLFDLLRALDERFQFSAGHEWHATTPEHDETYFCCKDWTAEDGWVRYGFGIRKVYPELQTTPGHNDFPVGSKRIGECEWFLNPGLYPPERSEVHDSLDYDS